MSSEKESKKASRKFHRPVPELIAQSIELVRLLPPNLVLPDIGRENKMIDEFFMGEVVSREKRGGIETTRYTNGRQSFRLASSDVLEARDSFISIINGLPEAFRSHLISKVQGRTEIIDVLQMMAAYSNFIETRNYLQLVLHIALRSQGKDSTRFHFALAPGFGGGLLVDDTGMFKTEISPFFAALEGIEAARIRECEVCQHIFWAGRLDQKCCTPQCAKVLRTRRWRELYYHVGESSTDDGYKLRRLRKRQLRENPKKGK